MVKKIISFVLIFLFAVCPAFSDDAEIYSLLSNIRNFSDLKVTEDKFYSDPENSDANYRNSGKGLQDSANTVFNNLKALSPGMNSIILCGLSQGGVTARRVAQMCADDPVLKTKIKGVLTQSTPQRGTPIANTAHAVITLSSMAISTIFNAAYVVIPNFLTAAFLGKSSMEDIDCDIYSREIYKESVSSNEYLLDLFDSVKAQRAMIKNMSKEEIAVKYGARIMEGIYNIKDGSSMYTGVVADVLTGKKSATLDLDPNSSFLANLNSKNNLEKEQKYRRASVMTNDGYLLDVPTARTYVKPIIDKAYARSSSYKVQLNACAWWDIIKKIGLQSKINLQTNLINTLEKSLPETYNFYMTGLLSNGGKHHDLLVPYGTIWWGKSLGQDLPFTGNDPKSKKFAPVYLTHEDVGPGASPDSISKNLFYKKQADGKYDKKDEALAYSICLRDAYIHLIP